MRVIAERIAELSSAVRHVAVSDDRSEPEIWERNPLPDSSSSESDRYEELLVNPTLLTLAGRRADIDCGGFDYLPVRYGSFFQLVVPTPSGHISVCLNPDADTPDLARRVIKVLALDGGSSSTQETSMSPMDLSYRDDQPNVVQVMGFRCDPIHSRHAVMYGLVVVERI